MQSSFPSLSLPVPGVWLLIRVSHGGWEASVGTPPHRRVPAGRDHWHRSRHAHHRTTEPKGQGGSLHTGENTHTKANRGNGWRADACFPVMMELHIRWVSSICWLLRSHTNTLMNLSKLWGGETSAQQCKMWETWETTFTEAWINKERSSRCADRVAWRESCSLRGKGHMLHLSRHMSPVSRTPVFTTYASTHTSCPCNRRVCDLSANLRYFGLNLL